MQRSIFRRHLGAPGRSIAAVPAALALGLAVGITPAPGLASTVAAPSADSAAAPTAAKRGRVTDHVVVISIDGLRPDAISKFGARTLQQLMVGGTFSLHAQTILPSKTLPSHTSMLTGVDADRHGITWNSDQTDEHGHVDVPTVFGIAKADGFRTAAFFSKPKFHHLEAPNTLDYVRSPKGGLMDYRWNADRTVAEVERYLESKAPAPNMMFVHIGEPDYAGHLWGWMSSTYGAAVLQADWAVSEILDEAEEKFGRGNFTVIVTADHGGHGKNHGSSDPRDTTIPWIAWGKGVEKGAALPLHIKTMDTAATALWLLGVNAPAGMEGNAVALAFADAFAVAN